MNIIFLGAPSSGKGTQAKFITERYKIPHISTGDLLRSFMKIHSRLSKQVQEKMNAGKLITDKLVIKLIKERIKNNDCCNGFILDGFPRTIFQAKSMKKNDIKANFILEFFLPDELIIDRIVGRRIHNTSGRIYHIKFNPPKEKDKDDITKEPLTIREDDKEEIVRKRIIEYHDKTIPLINYLRSEANFNHIQYCSIDATRKVDDIKEELINILG